MTEKEERARAEQLERTLARNIAWGVPATTLVLAAGMKVVFGIGPAIIVLAAGCFVGVIGLLWASLRTLAGDAPLAEGLASVAAMRSGVSLVAERKRRVLRALKDLELEHSLGKIDDRDYAEISARYREEAKGILREMDVEIEPLRSKAEAIVHSHLAKRGLVTDEEAQGKATLEAAPQSATEGDGARVACSACAASNEPDAAFCKKCRAPLARVACPSCATSNEPDATFCKKCGASLEAGARDRHVGAEPAEAKDG